MSDLQLEEIKNEEEFKKTLNLVLNEMLDFLDTVNPTSEEIRLEIIDDIYKLKFFANKI